MFELSHLTRSRNQLWSDLLTNLEGSGSNLALSEAELIAAARNTYGGSISAKTTSRAALIASLVNAAGGNVSERTHSEGQMLAALATALGGTASALSNSFEESLSIAVDETSGGGGGGGYTAQAVNIDGTVSLSIASLSSTDNQKFSWVAWVKQSLAANAGNSNPLFVSDPENNYATLGGFNYGNAEPYCVIANDDVSGSGGCDGDVASFLDDVWACYIFSLDAGTEHVKMYRGDTEITDEPFFDAAPFNAATNGLGFWLFEDGYGEAGTGLRGDFADIRIMPGISLLDVSGDIPEATRRLFVDEDGKPVDPATATTSLGVPCILFQRSGAAASFATNQGSGGAFTLTGTLASASTSPSD